MSDWQRIDDEAKNGQRRILWPVGLVAHWDWGDEDWLIAHQPYPLPEAPDAFFCHHIGFEPTHWMPLPDPPA